MYRADIGETVTEQAVTVSESLPAAVLRSLATLIQLQLAVNYTKNCNTESAECLYKRCGCLCAPQGV
jgi:hypothetical protein